MIKRDPVLRFGQAIQQNRTEQWYKCAEPDGGHEAYGSKAAYCNCPVHAMVKLIPVES